jgi:hypothetical protein
VLINLRSAAPASPITSCRALRCEVHNEIHPSERQDPAIAFFLRRVQRAARRELPAGCHHKPHLLRLPMLRRAPGRCGRDNPRLCEGIMITTGAAVCGPRHISNPCDLTLGNQERVVTYYEVATNGHGRVDLCTGRLEPRWRRAVHSAKPTLRRSPRSEPRQREWCR